MDLNEVKEFAKCLKIGRSTQELADNRKHLSAREAARRLFDSMTLSEAKAIMQRLSNFVDCIDPDQVSDFRAVMEKLCVVLPTKKPSRVYFWMPIRRIP